MTELENKVRRIYSKRVGPSTILVFKEKHGDRYFLVPDVSALLAIALKILEERFEEGWFEDGEDDEEAESLGLDEAAIVALPEGKVKVKALEELARHKEEVEEANTVKSQYTNVKAAIKEKNGALAFAILEKRSNEDYEYETFEWQTAEDVPELSRKG